MFDHKVAGNFPPSFEHRILFFLNHEWLKMGDLSPPSLLDLDQWCLDHIYMSISSSA